MLKEFNKVFICLFISTCIFFNNAYAKDYNLEELKALGNDMLCKLYQNKDSFSLSSDMISLLESEIYSRGISCKKSSITDLTDKLKDIISDVKEQEEK